MNEFLQTLRTALEPLRAQWQASAVLRMGLLLVVSVLVLEGLLRLMDRADAWVAEAAQWRQEIQTQSLSGTPSQWQERRDQVDVALTAWRERQWSGQDVGLLEAQLQDRLRDLAARVRLNVRDLSVVRNPALRDDSEIRFRLVTDMNRPALLALLGELETQTPAVIVDRLHLRLNSQPQLIEMELRAVRARAEATSP